MGATGEANERREIADSRLTGALFLTPHLASPLLSYGSTWSATGKFANPITLITPLIALIAAVVSCTADGKHQALDALERNARYSKLS